MSRAWRKVRQSFSINTEVDCSKVLVKYRDLTIQVILFVITKGELLQKEITRGA